MGTLSFFSISWLGELSLLLALIGCAYALGAAAYGAKKQERSFIHSARYATYACAALLSLASLVVLYALLSNDFSVKYVYHNSSIAMPWYYKLTAYWGGLDGSILFWAWLLSIFSAIAIHQNKERHADLLPWIIAILMGILLFFLILLIFNKPPFALFLQKVPFEGKGLSPLLQDPYMAIHPPSLYVGYVSASIPFAFGMAALITGTQDQQWVKSVRRWMIFCFYFLSQGLILGALWSYHVIGWGGYWAWDPVENAGLFPWFTATAFLHSILVEERKGIMRVWNILLVMITFLLTLTGTFLTRAGIVESIHAFGKDPELTSLFLAFLAFWFVLSFGFLVYRLPILRAKEQIESLLSREFAFLLNNWVLLSLAFFLLVATLAPTLTEALLRERIKIDLPFFNRWVSAFGLLLLLLLSIGPLLAWKKMSVSRFWVQIRIPFAVGLITLLGLGIFVPSIRVKSAFLHTGIQLPVSLICFGLCAMALASIVQEFFHGVRARKRNMQVGVFSALFGIILKSPKKYGGYVVHLGVTLMFFGFAGQPFEKSMDKLVSTKGQEISLGQYTIRYEGYQETFDVNKEKMEEVHLSILINGVKQGEMHPARWTYRQRPDEPRTIVQIRSNFRDDLYVTFQSHEAKTGLVSIKVQINALVTWVWTGFAFLMLGVVITLLPEGMKRLGNRKLSPVISLFLFGGSSLFLTRVLTGVFTGFLFLGLTHEAVAETQIMQPSLSPSPVSAKPQAEHEKQDNQASSHMEGSFPMPARSEVELEIRKQLVCLCGGCGRQPLSDCTCGFAAQDRNLIASLLDQGKTKEEVIAYLIQKHQSEEILRYPKDQGIHRLVWVLPVLGTLIALALLVVSRSKRKKPSDLLSTDEKNQETSKVTLSKEEEQKYQAVLDEELEG